MKCKFCYARFEDFNVNKQLSYEDACTIILKLKQAGVQKITFAGGEPMLYKHLDACIKFAKHHCNMTTSIITNGSMIKEQWLIDMQQHLDWIGLSVDSTSHSTNKNIGRESKMTLDYDLIVSLIHKYNYKLKINTVVNRYNINEDLNRFIAFANPTRWKVFQALKIEEQNDKQFDEIKVSTEEFNSFIDKHKHHKCIVPESNELMTSSYLLIDPLGRLFENTKGIHTYSDTLISNNIEHCLSQISLNRNTFLKRGGIYNWNN